MFGFQSLILNLFTLLTFMVPQEHAVHVELKTSAHEEVITNSNRKSSAIIESTLYLNQVLDTSQNSKLPFTNPFNQLNQTVGVAYESKLLYFSIGNTIDLEFPATSIIFPFHCFT
jgi:hypothetical protein